jgi:signal transduction histidine kinase
MNEPIDILLVDDEPRNLDALESILADPGYRLLRAYDADSALKLLLDYDVAAIVLDIKMPGTSGFELAQMIKATKRYRQIPILFLTAYLLEDQDVLTGYGAGAVDYLTKPLNPQIVRHKVSVFADLFRKTRALALLNEKLEERVRARTAELEKSEAALRTADHNKDEFIAILAHELRNPLAPLRFGLDILSEQQAGASPVAAQTIATMKRQLEHMVRLIDDLLDISRISRGAIELKRGRTDLATVIQGAIEIARPFIERRHHHLFVDAPQSMAVEGDSTRLAQIIGNLLHNAAKFTPASGHITVTLAREGDEAVIHVIDSGAGIAPSEIERAFEMFSRINGAGTTAERGLGIGLALGRRLAEMHGGTLTAASDGVGRGSTLTLRLPIVEPAAQAAAAGPAPTESAAMPALNIVVIEDSEDIANTLATVLEDMGHQVGVAYSGSDGLALVEERRPHVVLCDIGLPDIDGVEVCRRVRELTLTAQPRMIALTGWGRPDDRRRTTEVGFDEHLVKPVAVETLRRALRVPPSG